ncbi:MAG: VOC family protein [Pseudomonadota bacterium]
MRILETALYAENLEETAAFYERVLGLTRMTELPGRHIFFSLDDAVLLLFAPTASAQPTGRPDLPVPPHGAHGPGHVCFRADTPSLDDWEKRLEAAGVPIEARVDWPHGGTSLYFRDPAGNSLEVAEPRIWGL